MVTASGQLKLLDFGLASSHTGVGTDSNAATIAPRLTTAGAIVGPPAYMSPEQVLGQPADARSDVFAAGCVLYEMLAGRRPFSGNTAMEQIAAVVHGVATPIMRIENMVDVFVLAITSISQ